jgi:biopolymer transport protein ExbD
MSRRRARVEMIPLIDCMFILLVFFIYSMLSMTIQRGVPVNLPTGSTINRLPDEAIVVTITPGGDLFVNREPATLETLPEAMRQLIGEQPSPRIVLNADSQARHGSVFDVLDTLRRQGWTNVAILSSEAPER